MVNKQRITSLKGLLKPWPRTENLALDYIFGQPGFGHNEESTLNGLNTKYSAITITRIIQPIQGCGFVSFDPVGYDFASYVLPTAIYMLPF